MNYYCTAAAMPAMNKLSPEDINDLIDEESFPEGCFLVTDGWKNICLTSQRDFQPNSRVLKYGDFFTVIEYFENGIPEWLAPIPNLTLYAAEWNGGEWKYTQSKLGVS